MGNNYLSMHQGIFAPVRLVTKFNKKYGLSHRDISMIKDSPTMAHILTFLDAALLM